MYTGKGGEDDRGRERERGRESVCVRVCWSREDGKRRIVMQMEKRENEG
jgi:hypothetical protein